MNDSMKQKRKISWILPFAAGIMVIAALAIVFFVPGNSGKNEAQPEVETNENVAPQAPDDVSEINGEGKLVIYADRLSSDQISFLRISEDSRVELLARAGEDGTVKAALGTCQSCNGSPRAYYTQEGSNLKCNNCGLTFPISVLDSPGGGCHPIMLKNDLLRYEGNDLLIDLEGLKAYEPLFSNIADH